MSKFVDISGMRFGSLLVVKKVEHGKSGYAQWECLCDCGKRTVVRGANLRSGAVKSCGCLKHHAYHKSHGMSETRLYKIWVNMKARCNDPKNRSYKDYGAKGIHVCPEWQNSFECFFEWATEHGYHEDLTIERIDLRGHHCPENCTWVPKSDQANNRSMNRNITYRGKTQNLMQWCNELGLNYKRVHNRISRLGMSFEKAISMPVVKEKRNKEAKNKYG